MMRTLRLIVALCFAAFTGFLVTPASAAPALPTLPNGQTFHQFGFYDQRVATFDVTTATGTFTFPSLAAQNFTNPEGGGYVASTGLTWILEGSSPCRLRSLSSSGVWGATHILTGHSGCYAMHVDTNNTALVADNGTHHLLTVDLATGSVTNSVAFSNNVNISGISIDPTTSQIWISLPVGQSGLGVGLYKMNVGATAAIDASSRIDLSSVFTGPDIWDITFDGSGRLWLSMWEQPNDLVEFLASIVPSSSSPLTTFQRVGAMTVNGSAADSDALWITGTASSSTTSPNSGSSSSSSSASAGSQLAATGNAFGPLIVGGCAALIFGAVAVALAFAVRHRHDA